MRTAKACKQNFKLYYGEKDIKTGKKWAWQRAAAIFGIAGLELQQQVLWARSPAQDFRRTLRLQPQIITEIQKYLIYLLMPPKIHRLTSCLCLPSSKVSTAHATGKHLRFINLKKKKYQLWLLSVWVRQQQWTTFTPTSINYRINISSFYFYFFFDILGSWINRNDCFILNIMFSRVKAVSS